MGRPIQRASELIFAMVMTVTVLYVWVSTASAQSRCEDVRLPAFGNSANCRVIAQATLQDRHASLLLVKAADGSSSPAAPPGTEASHRFVVVTEPIPREGVYRITKVELPQDALYEQVGPLSGLRSTAALTDGVFLTSRVEKMHDAIHWWLSWPHIDGQPVSLRRWKAYRFDRLADHQGRTYYLGINGTHRIALGLRGDGVPELMAGDLRAAVLAQVPTVRHTFGAPPGLPVPIPFEDWHERIRHFRARVFSANGAVCEATSDQEAFFRAEPGEVFREWNGRRTSHPVRSFTADEYKQRRGKAGDTLLNQVQHIEMVSAIGPLQAEGPRLWFARAFYDGEGLTGVGGFGYLDCETGELQEHFPAEAAGYMASAMLVERDAVWLSLSSFGEYGSSSGGLLRWSRKDGYTHLLPNAPIAFHLVRDGKFLVLPHDAGMSVLDGDTLRHFAIREMPDGSFEVMQVNAP